MKKPLLLLATLTAALLCYGAGEKLEYTKEVRKQTLAGRVLFNDLLNGLGGLGMIDKACYPQAKERQIVKIEVTVPYDNKRIGTERWSVRHSENETAAYLINFVPDGQGGTYFSVKKEKLGEPPHSAKTQTDAKP